MIKKIQTKNLYNDKFIEEIKDSLVELNEDKEYNVIIEYFNEKTLSTGQDLENCEVDKNQLLLKKKVRDYFESKDINIKKLYILGSKDYKLMEEASFAVEEADSKEEKKDIIWPCKEIFFYDGGKKILDDMLYNDEIDIVEYENQIKTLKYEFGLLDEFEDELYLN